MMTRMTGNDFDVGLSGRASTSTQVCLDGGVRKKAICSKEAK